MTQLPTNNQQLTTPLLPWLGVALLAHLALLFLLRTSPTSIQALPQEAPPLTVILPGSREARQFQEQFAEKNSALFASDRVGEIALPQNFIPTYKPTYMRTSPRLKPLPEAEISFSLPPVEENYGAVRLHDPLPMPKPSLASSSTKIVLDGALKQRELTTPFKPFQTDRISKSELQNLKSTPHLPSVFLIAVTPNGSVRHAFLLQSSNSTILDNFAYQTLLRSKLTTIDEPSLTWGPATFLWGKKDIKRLKTGFL